tara:strand:+ start:1002 stop:2312 length:1311 start_codon:yes stop_codon:yes gene_type:complete
VFTIINIIVLIIIVLALIYFLFRFALPEPEPEPEECVDVNNIASFVHNTCYDAYTQSILMELKRSYDIYNIQSISLSFFDLSEKSHKITEIPSINQTKSYKIPAGKNPENINFELNIVKDFIAPICPEPRIFFVKYCPPGISQKTIEGKIIRGEEDEYIPVGEEPLRGESDILSMNLIEKERIWQSKCQSKWKCSEWEGCINGVKKRECTDTEKCFIPTDIPDFTKSCGGVCVENWECEWSDCNNGFTSPDCKDLNKCGTQYNIPQKLDCREEKDKCTPDITCEEWTECNANYNFVDLITGIEEIRGTKSRTCKDENSCSQTNYETKNCSLSVDIYTKRIRKCGLDYIGIYNKLNNKMIAKIEQSQTKNKQYLNIQLTNNEQEFCDFCFDGIKNGDEEQVDCGGSCKSCDEKQYIRPYRKPSTWSKFTDWLTKLVT